MTTYMIILAAVLAAFSPTGKDAGHDGMLKVKMGVTTPHEVMRNVYSIT